MPFPCCQEFSVLRAAWILFVILVLAPAVGAQGETRLVSADAMALACSNVATTTRRQSINEAEWATLIVFCNTKLFDQLPIIVKVPTTTVVREAARTQVDSASTGLRSVLPLTMGASASPVPFSFASGTVIAAEFIYSHAKQIATSSVIRDFARNLCKGNLPGVPLHGDITQTTATAAVKKPESPEKVSLYLPATCELLQTATAQEILGEGMVMPSYGVIQSMVRQDVRALPNTITERLQAYAAIHYRRVADTSASTPQQRSAQRLVAAVAGTHLVYAYTNRRSVPEAFDDALDVMEEMVSSMITIASTRSQTVASGEAAQQSRTSTCGTTWQHFESVRNILAGFAAIRIASRPTNRGSGVGVDVASAIRAYMVNAREAINTPTPLPTASALCAAIPGTWQSDGTLVFGATDSLTRAVAFWRLQLVRAIPQVAEIVDAVAATVSAAAGDQAKIREAYTTGAMNLVAALTPMFATATPDSSLQAIVRISHRVAQYPAFQDGHAYGSLVAGALGLIASVAEFDSSLSRFSLPPAVGRVLLFAADASEAKDSEGFRAALTNHVAPANTYMRKRNRGGWFVNSYVGINGGYEYARSGFVVEDKRGAGSYGVAMPLGVEFTLAHGKRGSLGLFSQVFDLGQVASWRLSSAENVDHNPPGLKIQTVFSPGAGFVYNFPRLPFALGGVIAYAPAYRDLTVSTSEQKRIDAFRLNVFLGIDVPLFGL